MSARWTATLLDGGNPYDALRRLMIELHDWMHGLYSHNKPDARDPFADFAAAYGAFVEAAGVGAWSVRVGYDPEADDAQFLFRMETDSKWWLARRQGAAT